MGLSGEALHNCLYSKGGKPSESFSETVLKAVMWGIAGGNKRGLFSSSSFSELELNM